MDSSLEHLELWVHGLFLNEFASNKRPFIDEFAYFPILSATKIWEKLACHVRAMCGDPGG